MAINNSSTTTGHATAFLASLFASRSPAIMHTTDNDTEITDWEFVNNHDLSDDDLAYILSDSESEIESALVAVSFVNNSVAKDHDLDIGSYGCMSDYGEKKERVEEEECSEEENDDLDDELVPWSVSDRFGRQRMRKLGTRAFAKMNRTTKKFAYTVNRPGCVRGKHGLGRKG